MISQRREETADRLQLWNRSSSLFFVQALFFLADLLNLLFFTESRELLLVFTGMAPHLPAHRKTRFVDLSVELIVSKQSANASSFIFSRLFSHLVEALGPSDFLGPVCMLLLEKAGSKLKQKSTDPLAAFSLPLSLIESFAGRVRFEVSRTCGSFKLADRY